MQIVLARLDQDLEIANEGRIDLGERHVFKSVNKPVSLMWKNDGSEQDVTKAEKFAASEGYKVFTYTGERHPLERAKRDIAA